MKKIITFLLSAILGTLLLFALVSCGECEHTYGEWVIDREATESTAGERHRECTKCGDRVTEDIPWLYAQGLQYELSEDGLSYILKGVGSFEGSHMAIPPTYNGLPITRLGEFALAGSTGLTSLTLPNSVTSIGAFAFSRCTELASISVENGNPKYHATGNCLIETETKTLVRGCKTSVIPADGSVTSIGEKAFDGCTGLTSITIPNGVTSINASAFSDCKKLANIMIPSSVRSIEKYAFSECDGLRSVTFAADSQCSRIGEYAFMECRNLTNFAFPNGVTSIGEWAFMSCYGLVSVTIPSSVTSIGNSAFGGTLKLIEVVNASSLDVAGSALHVIADAKDTYLTTDKNGYIFYDDGSKIYLVGYTGNDTDLVLPEVSPKNGKYEIYRNAFRSCIELTSITIPGNVTGIGRSAFFGCTELKDIYYTGTQSEWEAIIPKSDSWNRDMESCTIHYNFRTEAK